MRPSAKFSLLLCATLGAALLADSAKAKDTRTEAATAPAAEAPAQDTLATQNAAAEPAPASEPTLQEIIAAYHNDAPYEEATFIRDLELEDGNIALLYLTEDGQAEIIDTEHQQVVATPLLADTRCKIGITWQDSRSIGQYEKRFVPVKGAGKWTYADSCRGGSPLTPPIFDDVHPFKEGLGAVQYDRKWGFIDADGKLAIEPQFLSAKDFYNGICIVEFRKDGTLFHGGIAPDGMLLFALPDEKDSIDGVSHIYNFYEREIAKGFKGASSCAISRDGTILLHNLINGEIEFRLSSQDSFEFYARDGELCRIGVFDDSTYSQTKSERQSTFYGALDKQGSWIVDPVHKDINEAIALLNPSAGKSAKQKKDEASGLYGVADAEGNWLVEPQFATVRNWGTDAVPYFVVEGESGKIGVVDGNGMYILPLECDSIIRMHLAEPFWCTAIKDDLYGIVDANGNILIPFAYDYGAPEIEDFDYAMYAAGEFSFDRSAFTETPRTSCERQCRAWYSASTRCRVTSASQKTRVPPATVCASSQKTAPSSSPAAPSTRNTLRTAYK